MDPDRLYGEISKEINSKASLDQLAEQVRTAHRMVQQVWSNALDHTFIAGDALIEMQARGVGMPWKKWLRENCFLAVSTALLYMQIAEHRSEIEAALEKDPNLSLRVARRLITKSKTYSNKTKKAKRIPAGHVACLEGEESSWRQQPDLAPGPDPVSHAELATLTVPSPITPESQNLN